jgi:hypothetical protein
MQTLKQQFENLVDQYLTLFCEKQEVNKDNNSWCAGDIGEVIEINDAYLNFDDIRLDIDTNQPKGNIFKWYWENEYLEGKIINYYSYTKGLRVKDLK